MAVRDKLRRGAAQYLEPGEQIQAVFLVKRPVMQYNDRAVVATDRTILLLAIDHWCRVQDVLGEVPRGTKFGPCWGFMYPVTAFGTPLQVNSRFFKDVAEADRGADAFISSHPSGLVGAGARAWPDASPARYVVPAAGLYADPGGQAGVRYWNRREWSPLLAAAPSRVEEAPRFLGPLPHSLPEATGNWSHAAVEARRARNKAAVTAAGAALAVAAALAVNLKWLWVTVPLVLVPIRPWRTHRYFVRVDQAARGVPLAGPGAPSQVRRAGLMLAVSLAGTVIAVAATILLYKQDLSRPQADFSLAVLALALSALGLLLTWEAWQKFKAQRQAATRRQAHRKIDKAGKAAAARAGAVDSTPSLPGEAGGPR